MMSPNEVAEFVASLGDSSLSSAELHSRIEQEQLLRNLSPAARLRRERDELRRLWDEEQW